MRVARASNRVFSVIGLGKRETKFSVKALLKWKFDLPSKTSGSKGEDFRRLVLAFPTCKCLSLRICQHLMNKDVWDIKDVPLCVQMAVFCFLRDIIYSAGNLMRKNVSLHCLNAKSCWLSTWLIHPTVQKQLNDFD